MYQIEMTKLSGNKEGVQKQAFPITSGYSTTFGEIHTEIHTE